jgi:hypothetical protein
MRMTGDIRPDRHTQEAATVTVSPQNGNSNSNGQLTARATLKTGVEPHQTRELIYYCASPSQLPIGVEQQWRERWAKDFRYPGHFLGRCQSRAPSWNENCPAGRLTRH